MPGVENSSYSRPAVVSFGWKNPVSSLLRLDPDVIAWCRTQQHVHMEWTWCPKCGRFSAVNFHVTEKEAFCLSPRLSPRCKAIPLTPEIRMPESFFARMIQTQVAGD